MGRGWGGAAGRVGGRGPFRRRPRPRPHALGGGGPLLGRNAPSGVPIPGPPSHDGPGGARLWGGHADQDAGRPRMGPQRVRRGARVGGGPRRGGPHPRHPGPPPRRAPRRDEPGLADGLRRIRGVLRPRVRRPAPAAPAALRLRDRPRARRRRDGARLVRGRKGTGQGAHVHRLHRRGRVAGLVGVGGPVPPGRRGAQRGRPPHGRRRQQGARPVPGGARGGALRRCPHHHPRRVAAADRRRVAGVGRSHHGSRRLRGDARLHPLRERSRGGGAARRHGDDVPQ